MANIYTSTSFTLANGTIIALPLGVNAGITKNGVRYAIYSTDRRHKVSSTTQPLDVVLETVLLRFKADLLAGFIPGMYNKKKSKASANSDMPTGLQLRQIPTTKHWKIDVCYPNLETERVGRTTYYAGTELTHEQKLPLALKRATEFRTEKLNEYSVEFLRRLNLTIAIVLEANSKGINHD